MAAPVSAQPQRYFFVHIIWQRVARLPEVDGGNWGFAGPAPVAG